MAGHVLGMNRVPPTLDMRPDGSFRLPPPRAGISLSSKLFLGSVLLASVAGMVAMAALALWVLSLALPVLVVAGVSAWAMVKYRRWQAFRGGRSLRPF